MNHLLLDTYISSGIGLGICLALFITGMIIYGRTRPATQPEFAEPNRPASLPI